MSLAIESQPTARHHLASHSFPAVGECAVDSYIRGGIAQSQLSLQDLRALSQKIIELTNQPKKGCDLSTWNKMCHRAALVTASVAFSPKFQYISTSTQEGDPFSLLPSLLTLFSRKDLSQRKKMKLLHFMAREGLSDEEFPSLITSKVIPDRIRHFSLMRRHSLTTKKILNLPFLSLLIEPRSTKRVKGFLKCLDKGFTIRQLSLWDPRSLIFQFELENSRSLAFANSRLLSTQARTSAGK